MPNVLAVISLSVFAALNNSKKVLQNASPIFEYRIYRLGKLWYLDLLYKIRKTVLYEGPICVCLWPNLLRKSMGKLLNFKEGTYIRICWETPVFNPTHAQWGLFYSRPLMLAVSNLSFNQVLPTGRSHAQGTATGNFISATNFPAFFS
jgi:hypothetical protein